MRAIDVSHVTKQFEKGTKALNDVSFSVENGEMVALIGASGSGKSTLIRHIGGLICCDPGDGKIAVLDNIVQQKGRIAKKARATRSKIGIIFQQFNLVMRLSVLTNILVGKLGHISQIRGCLSLFSKEEKQQALMALDRVGILKHAYKKASQLSGGQQQRAAIARAIVQEAEIILADEPIASLDPASARKVMNVLRKINQEDQVTVLVSLHQVDYAREFCPRTIAMKDGEMVFDGPSTKLTPDFLQELYGEDYKDLVADTSDQDDLPADLAPHIAATTISQMTQNGVSSNVIQ